jgi:alkanesulfonate monooxygenase SsuD/methylene tetrahydromethanopterin reductase-like flavin-dependent oxidoreductase (luciferase family)
MPLDYGRPIEFGISLIPDASQYPMLARITRLADELGFELAGFQDHPYQRRFLDTWTLLSALGAQTSRIRVFPDVANLPLRPPAVLAKAAASLDVITNGRVELGLGAGGFWDAIRAMGGPVREPRDSILALEEAIEITRLVWSGERGLRFDGRFYKLEGVHSGPVPVHRIEIWLGVYRRRGLELTGRMADGWLPSMGYQPLAELPAKHARIDEAALKAGRRPQDVRRLFNVAGDLEADQLAELALEFGMDTFIVWFEGDLERQLRGFAEEVAPAVRSAVEKTRAGRSR